MTHRPPTVSSGHGQVDSAFIYEYQLWLVETIYRNESFAGFAPRWANPAQGREELWGELMPIRVSVLHMQDLVRIKP